MCGDKGHPNHSHMSLGSRNIKVKEAALTCKLLGDGTRVRRKKQGQNRLTGYPKKPSCPDPEAREPKLRV